MHSGKFDKANIEFIDVGETKVYEIIELQFSDETTIQIIEEHGLWNFDINNFMFIKNDASKYIGNWFQKSVINEDGSLGYKKVQLSDVKIYSKQTTPYSPITREHLNYYANGILSMNGAMKGWGDFLFTDIYEIKYDEEVLERDIKGVGGLFTYESFKNCMPNVNITKRGFDIFNCQYLPISIATRKINWARIEA